MKTITSMNRTQFEELRAGILNGTLAKKWSQLEDKEPEELTRKQAVELRRLSWLLSLCESNPNALADIIKRQDWKRLKVIDRGSGMAETQIY